MMNIKVHGFVLVAIFGLGACGDDGPGLEDAEGGGTAGETGEGGIDGCAPDDEFVQGYVLPCQGAGGGWLVTDIYGAGNANPIVTCLAWDDPGNIPEKPTSADCASLPLDQIPFDIPAPAACCDDTATEGGIIATCASDCGHAACKTAVAAIRASADELEPPPGANDIVVAAFETSKADLYGYADILEAHKSLEFCAEKVADGAGEVVSLTMGGGVSSPLAFGHIKDATLYLGCILDPDEPYIPSADVCSDPTNIPPKLVDEQEAGGPITGGTVTILGPGGVESVPMLRNATVSTHEAFNGDGAVDFTLTSLEADLPGLTVGSVQLHDAHISLAGPASGSLVGDTVTFVPGTLRFAVSAVVYLDGEPLFGGLPMLAEYGNDAPATAIRGLGGMFHFEEAIFVFGEHSAVLSTEPSVLAPAQ